MNSSHNDTYTNQNGGKMTECKHILKEIEQIKKGYIYYKCKKCGDILVDEFAHTKRKKLKRLKPE